ncbi:MAG: hypothetical protein J6O61_06665 [Butyrivibrio sp.]|uniref:hypothetical protein n=1 Tax=Butyrivibrio sp. TaxID=28121 RepID=UPI001B23E0F2|nr:hypothetical protein [Butyrivibrio sp.]MBO6240511.1 hypothetical protein [Butyrivibrio sp.]
MSEKYDTVIAHDTDDMIEMVMGPREHLACIVVDAKRGIEYNFAMHKEMKSDMGCAFLITDRSPFPQYLRKL